MIFESSVPSVLTMARREAGTPKAFPTIAQACRASGCPGRARRPSATCATLCQWPSPYPNVLVHVVFSTKERHPFLADSALRAATHRYLSAVSAELRCPVITVGGVEDHVHVLARQARTITLAAWIRELKRASSLWVKDCPNGPERFQ